MSYAATLAVLLFALPGVIYGFHLKRQLRLADERDAEAGADRRG